MVSGTLCHLDQSCQASGRDKAKLGWRAKLRRQRWALQRGLVCVRILFPIFVLELSRPGVLRESEQFARSLLRRARCDLAHDMRDDRVIRGVKKTDMHVSVRDTVDSAKVLCSAVTAVGLGRYLTVRFPGLYAIRRRQGVSVVEGNAPRRNLPSDGSEWFKELRLSVPDVSLDWQPAVSLLFARHGSSCWAVERFNFRDAAVATKDDHRRRRSNGRH